jgi:hypothetical protein
MEATASDRKRLEASDRKRLEASDRKRLEASDRKRHTYEYMVIDYKKEQLP